MKHKLFNPLRLMLPVLITVCFSAVAVLASGSSSSEEKPKSGKDKQSEQKAKAVDKYNEGVKYMTAGNKKASQKDSTYAFNYRATSDAKARKEYEKAVERFEQAVKLDAAMKEAHNNLGYCYRRLDKLELSLASYERALKLDPNFEQAREYLGETYLALGKMDKAKGELDRLKELKSAYADTLSLAIQLFQLKDIDKAMNKSEN